MQIVPMTEKYLDEAAPLVAAFRVELAGYRGLVRRSDPAAGREEIGEYVSAGWPVFAAMEGEQMVGYAVCRVDAPTVWLESIYVRPDFRGKGVADALFERAEEIAHGYGENTMFNYVHPNNSRMIAFLKRKGYTVLNLIEIRKPYPGETTGTKISVGENTFDY